jgi:hypothetical protein
MTALASSLTPLARAYRLIVETVDKLANQAEECNQPGI